jgi:4'-phosphopantetheinyl transferase
LPRFTYGENGKPYLTGKREIFFNISHCKTGVVCAISDKEVGVDMQDIQPFDRELAKRVCTAGERMQLEQSDTPDRLFCKWWTIKEAYIKRYGGSIADGPDKIEAEALPFFTMELVNIQSYLCCTDADNHVISEQFLRVSHDDCAQFINQEGMIQNENKFY